MTDLRDELLTDPLSRGYSTMLDQEVADDLNSIYPAPDTRTRNRASMSGDEIAQQAVPAAYDALDDGAANNTADVKSHWLALCARTSVDPFATANVQLVVSIFGVGSQTVLNLQAARVESITRAQELGLSLVRTGHVQFARSV